MAESPTPPSAPKGSSGGFFSRPIANSNNVHKHIREIQASKAAGNFTFRAGRYDRAINLALGIGMCFLLANVGRGVYQLSYGIGKKEGF